MRKYLDDLGIKSRPETWGDKKDERSSKWKEQRKIYGFDERETWALDATFLLWLYERVKMFLEKAEPNIDLNYHKFTYKENTLTQKEIILKIINNIEEVLKTEEEGCLTLEIDNKVHELKQEAVNLWALVFPAMWW